MTGRILRNVRKIRGYTQEYIAKQLNLAGNSVSNYETEISNPTFETVVRFMKECDFEIQLVDKTQNKIYTLEELSEEMDF